MTYQVALSIEKQIEELVYRNTRRHRLERLTRGQMHRLFQLGTWQTGVQFTLVLGA